jgi:general secretion pathway protein D
MIFITSFQGLLRAAAVAVAVLVLAGCAGEQAYRDGMNLIDQGQYEQGLARLQEASNLSPSDDRYRMALLNNRTLAVERLTALAATAEAQGRPKDAEALYRRALAVDPNNVRTKESLRLLEKSDSFNEMVRQAQAAFARKDYDQTALLLSSVLSVNPRYPSALALQSKLDQARAKDVVTLPQLKSRFTKPVTLEFRDANLKMVFDVLSRTSGINFIFDKDVKGDTKVTIYVRNVPVEDAIDLLLTQSQLEKKVLSDNSVLIYPNTPQKLKEFQDLVIRSFYLGNGDAKQTLNLIKTILKTKDVYVDERLNLLVMRDTPDAIRLAEKLIYAQDMAEPEVLLEMEVLEVLRDKAYDMGITWPSTFTLLVPDPSNPGQLIAPTVLSQLGTPYSSNRIGIDSTIIAKLRQDNTISNLISNPRVRVKNREKARVLVGNRQPVISAQVTPGATNPIVTETVQYLDIGLKLEVEPTVLLDDDVAMKVSLEVSTQGQTTTTKNGTTAIAVNTRNVNTAMRLRDGETAVMMGFIRDDAIDNHGGIPGLTDLPFPLNRLFSSGKGDFLKNEILFSITPRIIRNVRRPDMQITEFWSGTEATLRSTSPLLQSAATAAARAGTPPQPAAAPVPPAGAPAQPAMPAQPTAPPSMAPPQPAAPPAGQPETQAPPPSPQAAAAPDASQAAAAPPAAPGGPPQPLSLSWNGPAEAKVGSEITVALMANSPDPLLGAGVVLKFDPAVLQVLKVDEGTFLKQGGVDTTFNSSVTPTVGRLVASARRTGDAGAQGAGSLLTITFKVMAPAQNSPIQLLSASPVSAGGSVMRFQAAGPLTVSATP